MHDEMLATRLRHGAHKIAHKVVALATVQPNAVLHRHRHIHHVAHGLDAIGHQLRLCHQASTKRTALNPLGGAAAIQVDFLVTPLRTQLGGLGQIGGFAAAQLQRHRLLFGIEVEVPGHIAVDECAGGDHLGVEQRVARQQTVEVAAVPIGPVHHRGHRQRARARVQVFRH